MYIFSYLDVILIPVILFLIGLTGFFINRKNIIIILMAIEIVLLASNLNFILASVSIDDLFGFIAAIFVLTIAAAESAIGLAILVVYYRVTSHIVLDLLSILKG